MVIRQTNKKRSRRHTQRHLPQHDIIFLHSIKYYKSTNNTRHPTAEREQKDDEHRTTALIDDRQGLKCQRHGSCDWGRAGLHARP